MLSNLLRVKLLKDTNNLMKHDSKNIMVILSSPSGVGKTTLTKKIQQKYQTFKTLSIIQQTPT